MSQSIWESISKRLIKEIKEDKNAKSAQKHQYNNYIPFSGNIKEGIINYLRKNDNNISEEIEVTRSSLNTGDVNLLLQIGEESKKNVFGTGNNPNSWICFEFKNHQIKLTNYTIRTYNGWKNSWNPKMFVIEGSNNGNGEWIKIDEQKNCRVLNEGNFIHTFSIEKTNHSQFFKYIRIRQTGPNWTNSNYLFISSIEFYGFIN